jgi:hypothetical protein
VAFVVPGRGCNTLPLKIGDLMELRKEFDILLKDARETNEQISDFLPKVIDLIERYIEEKGGKHGTA